MCLRSVNDELEELFKLQRSMAILKVDVRYESSTSLLVMGMKLLEATMLAKRSTRSALDHNRRHLATMLPSPRAAFSRHASVPVFADSSSISFANQLSGEHCANIYRAGQDDVTLQCRPCLSLWARGP